MDRGAWQGYTVHGVTKGRIWLSTHPFLPSSSLLSTKQTINKDLLCSTGNCSVFCSGSSLVSQWIRIHLPMQGTRVWTLVLEDPTYRAATKPVHPNFWACTLEPLSHNQRAYVLQLLDPVRLSLCSTVRRATAKRRPHTTTQRSLFSPQPGKAREQQRRPSAIKKKKILQYGKRVWKRIDICTCISESLCHTLETNTTWYINYSPIQNKSLKKGTIIYGGKKKKLTNG